MKYLIFQSQDMNLGITLIVGNKKNIWDLVLQHIHI